MEIPILKWMEIFARGHQIWNLNKIGQLVSVLCKATDRKLKFIFLVSGILPGKSDSVILLVFVCTIKPQNLLKIVGAIYENMKIKFFM